MYDCVNKCKLKDPEALLILIQQFDPLIKKYSRKYYYDDIESLLIIALIQSTERIDLKNFSCNSTGQLINYFSNVIENTYKDKLKEFYRKDNNTLYLGDEILCITAIDDSLIGKIEFNMDVEHLLSKLNVLQRSVIQAIFFEGLSEVEIARQNSITRQAVCNIKQRALRKMKLSYGEVI